MKSTDPYLKICKYAFCKISFNAKRTNQEFCCRDHYVKHNNLKAKTIRDLTKSTDKVLHLNRHILSILSQKGTVSANDFSKLGYKISQFTSIRKNEKGENVFGCYEYIIENVGNGNYKIYKNE